MIKPRIIAVRVYRVSLSASVYLPTFINLTPNLFHLTQKRKSGTFCRHNIDAFRMHSTYSYGNASMKNVDICATHSEL